MGHEDHQIVLSRITNRIDHIQSLVNIGPFSTHGPEPIQTKFRPPLLLIGGSRDLGQLHEKPEGFLSVVIQI
jgi:hypothetical protein